MLKITSDIIQVGDDLYPTKNISSVTKDDREVIETLPLEARPFRGLALTLITFGIIWLNFKLMFSFTHFVLIGSLSILLFVFLKSRLLPHREPQINKWYEHRILLVMNSRNTNLIIMKNAEFRDQVLELVANAISTSSNNAYNINVENMAIESVTEIDNSVTHNGDVINNYDFSINYHQYPNLDEISETFLKTKFENALSQLMKDAVNENIEPIQTELKSLAETIKDQKPSKNAISTAFSRLERVVELYSKGSSAVEAIKTGVGLLTSALAFAG